MKSYEQMARSVLSRRDQILKREQQRKLRFFRYAARVSTACGAMALCIGAVAVWNNIKDTQKNLDEFVQPTEPTTQTTVALPESDNTNDNTSGSVIQDAAETTAPAVTTKVVVTSVSKNKDGEKVIVTTEVAVPVRQAEPQVTKKPIIGPSPNPISKTTTRPVIGPSPTPTSKTTARPIIGPSPIPTSKTTSKPIIGPIPIPTTHSTALTAIPDSQTHPTSISYSQIIITKPVPITSVVYPVNTTVLTQTTPYYNTTIWATSMVKPATTWATYIPEPQVTTNVGTAWAPAPESTHNNDYAPYNLYRTFSIDGRYFNDSQRGSYQGETSDMNVVYTGYVTFYDQQNNPVNEYVTIYARSGEYQAIVYFSSQYRYAWYSMSYPY